MIVSSLSGRTAVALLAMTLAAPTVGAAATDGSILSLQTGHSIVVHANGVTRLAVGDGRIAGLVPVGRNAVVINGKAPGHTTVFIWEGGSERVYEVTVTEQGLDEFARILRSSLSEPNLQVETVGSNVFVRGSVPDITAFNHVNDVIAQFSGTKVMTAGSGDKVPIINAVTVAKPLGNLQGQLARTAGGQDVRADIDSTGNVVVTGSVRDQRQEQQILDQVRTLAGPYLHGDAKVVNRLGVQTTSQVDIKVYVLEVDKTAQSDLGLSLQTGLPGTIGVGAGAPYTLSSSPSITVLEGPQKNTFNPFAVGPFARISILAPTLNLLQLEGHAKLLSSPNLVTEPGQAANFLVGGEIPIPVSNGLGTVSLDYKQYGVQLAVTPTILGNGAVEAKIAPEISDLDFANGIQLNGFVVPAFKTSKLSTDVVTQSGESIVMGGLIRRVEQRNIQKFPILGDLPILGALFRSTNYQHADTDIVFVMTPTVITK